MKANLEAAADRGERSLRLTAGAFSNDGLNLDRSGCMQALARSLKANLEISVVGESDTCKCNMGDSAAPCWTTETTHSLTFSW